MTITGEEERCLLHARIAARQAVLKGLDRETLADAFMIEAIKLTFGVDDAEAARLAQRWKEQTFRLLDADYVTRAGTEGGPKVVRLLRAESRDRLLGNTALRSRA
jgi:acyl-CoA synthetase (NDP forming)